MGTQKIEFLSTEEFGRELKVKQDTIRRSFCTQGHYLGVRPRKLPNGRLRWPAAEVHKLLDWQE